MLYETNRIMKKKLNLKPTESELEILAVLWQHDYASVRTVHEALSQTKDVGYTTTLKLMQIMYEKGLVVRNSDAKTHLYKAAIEKEKTQLQIVNKLIKNVFAGSSVDMVLQALGGNKTTAAELKKIEELIATLKLKNK